MTTENTPSGTSVPETGEPLPAPEPSVLFLELEDGGVLYSADMEVYFGLNPVGVRIWRFLEAASGSLDELVRDLDREHPEVDAQTLRLDVEEFVEELLRSRLVTRPL